MPKRILLADDSITIQKVVELTFSDGDYEVTAVNNGARAIQKLGEMRPDIILSDIIMPEKNGYEVCEYVKSHPEHRNIPVVLLTGTFEPFDPDRAEKAGCDAVVTKPFESQSLIHKVEELIAQARATVQVPIPVAPPPPAPEPVAAPPEPIEEAPSPWIDDAPIEAEAKPSPFTTSTGSFPAPPEAYAHDADIFNAPPPEAPEPPIQFDAPAADPFEAPPAAPAQSDEYSGETRAFPRMSFDDFQQAGAEPAPPEPSPWDEPDFGGETRAFGKMTFDDLQAMAPQAAPEPEPAAEPEPLVPQGLSEPTSDAFDAPTFDAPAFDAPFGAPPDAEAFSGETRAFPRMTFDELQQLATPPVTATVEPEPALSSLDVAFDNLPQPEPVSPFDAPDDAPLAGGQTQAFPAVSFDELQQQMSTPAPEPEPEPIAPQAAAEPEPSPWDEQPAFGGGETQAFPKMSYEELAASAEPEPAPWELPSSPAEEPAAEEEEEAFAAVASPDEAPEEEVVAPPPALAPDTPAIPIRGSDLSDEQVDRIARRVVELMSDQVIRNIAWEVIPDLAEMVVKERIRQLESEA